ncbi:MAG: hypothetical protein H0V17_17205, partial [Deltaproteobacteria bacterium]|nr:hypothetical protein [Deltaproteobacteria bacterium]
RKLPSPTARLALKPGELAEGSYRFWVEIPDTGGRSGEARIVIDFDNAQPTASFEKVEVKDGKVNVKGTVIEKTTVSSAGVPIALDRHLRFETTLAPQPGETGVAVRIAHPKLGVHYYVVGSGLK